jgi:hypothetical protein
MARGSVLLPGLVTSRQCFTLLLCACIERCTGHAASDIFLHFDTKVPSSARRVSRHSTASICSLCAWVCVTCRVHLCTDRSLYRRLDRSSSGSLAGAALFERVRFRRASDHACESRTRTAVLLLPSSPPRHPSCAGNLRECELYTVAANSNGLLVRRPEEPRPNAPLQAL